MSYTSTILTISVHQETDNPIFGASATHITIEDQSGGPYITITQCQDNPESGTVVLEFEQFKEVVKAVNILEFQKSIRNSSDIMDNFINNEVRKV